MMLVVTPRSKSHLIFSVISTKKFYNKKIENFGFSFRHSDLNIQHCFICFFLFCFVLNLLAVAIFVLGESFNYSKFLS